MYDSDLAVNYSSTNENLQAIVEGLAPSSEDSVLAIAGSGDQAFALLEFAGRVEAVDISQNQIEFMHSRVKALKERDYTRFFDKLDDGWILDERSRRKEEERRAYFLDENLNRLERIRKKLDNLVIAPPRNIFDTENQPKFSRIYLSNTLGYPQGDLYLSFDEKERLLREMVQMVQILSPEGLVYVSNHGRLCRAFGIATSRDFWEPDPLRERMFLPNELELVPKLSMRSRNFEKNWEPAVYRRIK